jgi:hypothetical protein
MGAGRKVTLFIAGAGVLAAILGVVSNSLPILANREASRANDAPSDNGTAEALRIQQEIEARRKEQEAAEARALELKRQSEAACIRNAITQGRSTASPSDPTATAAAFRKISLEGCPADFVDQAVRYVQAIERAAGSMVELEGLKKRMGGAIFSRALGDERPLNDLQQRGNELEQRFKAIQADHLSAAQEMERIAARYGIQERISDP